VLTIIIDEMREEGLTTITGKLWPVPETPADVKIVVIARVTTHTTRKTSTYYEKPLFTPDFGAQRRTRSTTRHHYIYHVTAIEWSTRRLVARYVQDGLHLHSPWETSDSNFMRMRLPLPGKAFSEAIGRDVIWKRAMQLLPNMKLKLGYDSSCKVGKLSHNGLLVRRRRHLLDNRNTVEIRDADQIVFRASRTDTPGLDGPSTVKVPIDGAVFVQGNWIIRLLSVQ